MSKKEILHIYIRCSTDKQIEKSVERQKSKGIEFSKQLGMKPKFWIDGGKSRFGGLDKREQITDLLTEVELGVVNHIWVEDWSRISGEVEDIFQIEPYILNEGVKIYEGNNGNQPYEPNDVMKKMFQIMKTMMTKEGKKDEIQKSIETKIRLFQQGYHMKGNVFGYKLVDRKQVIDRNQSKWVKKIFSWYVNDKMSLQQICDELRKNNVPTPRSKTRYWSKENVKKILTNENYIGINTFTDKSKDPNKKDPKKYPFPNKEVWRVYKNTSPRIIDDETWSKVSKRLDRQNLRPTKRQYLLHGKLQCECGNKWVGRWYSLYNKHFYHCLNNERKYFKNVPNRKHLHSDTCSKPKRIGGEILDRYIWENLLSTLSKSSWIKERVKKEILGERYGISSMRKNLNKDKKRLEKEIKTFERNKVDFIKDKYTTSLNEFDYDEIISSIDEKIYELQSDYKKLQDKEMIMDKRGQWIDWLNHHNKNVDDLSKIEGMKERRRVIDFYIDKITLDWDKVTKQHTIRVYYKYPLVGDGLIRKGGKMNWDEWGNGYRLKKGERVHSLSSSNFFLTRNNYQSLFNGYRLDFDSYIPFLVYVFYTKTHRLSPSYYNKSLSKHRENLHQQIFKLYNQGLGYRKIHKNLVENGWEIGKSPTTVDSIIRKRLKRNEILNQPIVEEYQDFDIQFVGVEKGVQI